ncbi:RAMP superfamily CRISPR-associated protein [Sporosarcina limicola]|uniref:CRISPR type III-associated protein domain-containing protein n=1 Tax=Sporosarcina limicola TaxID=34101 RepID=A0A927MM26_9BACL|nr:RAMP superfamily CRISPR-associated protein [Sporosarcina limicola]MBE1555402.1 hypothetical protein [Sporosarcina limicola]
MRRYCVIEVENIEPLKIGAGGSKSNQTEPSKDYIPGSTLRGAVIANLIRHGVFNDTTATEILQKMECYNAYPYQNGKLFVPTPQHLRVNKHQWRKAKMMEQETSSIESKKIELSNLLKDRTDKNPLEYQYVAFHEDYLSGIEIPKTYRQHHTTRLKEENLFSYQAISPGQTFRAMIALEESMAEEIEACLRKPDVWYVGGSKGSGYGRCNLKVVSDGPTSYERAKQLLGLPFEPVFHAKELTITCLSDCLFRNEKGQPMNFMPVSIIEEVCEQRVELNEQLVGFGLSEGYNAKWQARYPKETTLKAGSIFTYKFEPALDKAEWPRIVNALESKLAGFRTQDGYGWIGVNIPYPTELQVKAEIQEKQSVLFTNQLKPSEQKEDSLSGSAAEVHEIIRQGLQATRGRWLNMIYDLSSNSTEPSIVIANLKRHHCMKMLEKLVGKKQEIGMKGQEDSKKVENIERKYEMNNKNFSIAGFNFKEILAYLSIKETTEEYAGLIKFAETKLNSKKGKLYYTESANRNQQFIADLLEAGLTIYHWREKDE